MLLKYIYIKDYKKLKEFEVQLVPENGFNSEYRDYYSNMNISTLVGENGMGKTTVLSFIAQIFHYLERKQDNIDSDFVLKYSIQNNETKSFSHVQIRMENKSVFITLPNEENEFLLLEWKHIKAGRGVSKRKPFQEEIDKPSITYDEIKKYLPSNVITSVFSLHSEYPREWNRNYYGDRILKEYDITSIYGSDHFKGASLSKGIARFLKLYITQNELLTDLLNSLNLEFAPFIKIYLERSIFKTESPIFNMELESGWLNLYEINDSKSIEELISYFVNAEFNEEIFINDLAFYKGENIIDLGKMSSGEKMFFYRIFSILSVIDNNSLVIIEEPELHLNPSWTKQIITMFYLLFSTYNAHFLIATHSYSFINSLFPENILLFTQEKVSHPSFNTFLSNEKEITSKLFYSSTKQNYTESRLLNKIKNSSDEQLEYIMSYLGESFYKFMIFNELFNSEEKE